MAIDDRFVRRGLLNQLGDPHHVVCNDGSCWTQTGLFANAPASLSYAIYAMRPDQDL